MFHLLPLNRFSIVGEYCDDKKGNQNKFIHFQFLLQL